MWWTIPRIWNGGDVWIIGGGPSIIKQFGIPSEIVEQVRSGELSPSAYSTYMKAIHNKHVIAINAAFLIGNWIDFVFFGDKNFFLRFEKELSQFPKPRISSHEWTKDVDWIKTLKKQPGKPFGISDKPKFVSWNSNSGGASISLAAHLGVKRIFLLGFDMKLGEANEQHWHEEYTKKRLNDDPTPIARRLPFKMHSKGFKKQIVVDAKAWGIEIINVSPESALEAFPRMTLQEALKL